MSQFIKFYFTSSPRVMGVPTSEVGYTSAMPRREDHEFRKGHVGHWTPPPKKKNFDIKYCRDFPQSHQANTRILH